MTLAYTDAQIIKEFTLLLACTNQHMTVFIVIEFTHKIYRQYVLYRQKILVFFAMKKRLTFE